MVRAVSVVLLLVSVALGILFADYAWAEDFASVTCGSTIKLTHRATGFKLHSHEIPYGTGSRQQSVTAFPNPDDPNSYWVVRSAHGADPCRFGEPVRCGSVIRLQHLQTKHNLHSHLHESPMSRQQEVSAFGDEHSGDTGDNWRVECDGLWGRGRPVHLQHVDTGRWLSSSAAHRYGHPIAGQQEVCAVPRRSSDTAWQADEGVYFAPRKAQDSQA